MLLKVDQMYPLLKKISLEIDNGQQWKEDKKVQNH